MAVNKFKRRFTKWYVKRGYTFGYIFRRGQVIEDDDNLFRLPCGIPEVKFTCPFWVKPLLIFFSPSVYYMEAYGRVMAEAFAEGMRKGMGMRERSKYEEFDGRDGSDC